jgi:ABC-type phosphate/phosphonate transport system substrate-binding protein
MNMNSINIGAVVYDPKVTVIWGIIADFFKQQGLRVNCVFYPDYKAQVDGLFDGEIDIAWNSPLAWVDSYIRSQGSCLNGSMRDTDRDRKTCLIVRKNSGIQHISALKNKVIGFGALDSPQARLIPINFLHNQGLVFGQDYLEKRYDIGVGLHGDHIGGELDAVKALMAGEVDAAFTLDLNWQAWLKDGTVDGTQLTCLAATPLFDHCIFVGRPDFPVEQFTYWNEVLHRMDYSNPDHKAMMDMEGLKCWVEGRTSGFAQLQQACQYLNFFDAPVK